MSKGNRSQLTAGTMLKPEQTENKIKWYIITPSIKQLFMSPYCYKQMKHPPHPTKCMLSWPVSCCQKARVW